MKVSTETGGERQTVVQVEVEPAELEQALERAYRRVVRQVNINGFRPGKAPRRIVEQRLGRGVLIEEAARDLVPKLTNEVVTEQQLDIITEPDVEITSLEPFSFKAVFSLRPAVTLGDYTAIRLAPREAVVTEEQVDEVIERLRQQRGTWIDLEEPRPAAKGDLATIDLASSIDGEPLEETQQDVPAVLGEPNGLLPELESAIIGLNVGDQTSTTVTFPEDYRQEKVAGKEVRFDITLKKLQARQLPDLDDAFVASVTDLTSLEALRQRVRENLQEKATEDVRREMAQAVIDLVTDQATVEMPPVLVNNQIDRQLHERQHVFERQGLRWENVLQMLGKDEEQVREEERPLAERRVRSSLTLLEIARVEGLEVSASEVDEEIERLVSGYDDPRQARRNFERPAARQAIESSLFETRIIDRLVEIATEGRGYIAAPGEGGQLPGAAEITATAETSEPDTPADAEPADETASDAPTDARPSA